MGSSTHGEGRLVGDLGSRRGDGRCGGVQGRRLKSPEGERAKEVYSVLMHVLFWLPNMSESDGALHD